MSLILPDKHTKFKARTIGKLALYRSAILHDHPKYICTVFSDGGKVGPGLQQNRPMLLVDVQPAITIQSIRTGISQGRRVYYKCFYLRFSPLTVQLTHVTPIVVKKKPNTNEYLGIVVRHCLALHRGVSGE